MDFSLAAETRLEKGRPRSGNSSGCQNGGQNVCDVERAWNCGMINRVAQEVSWWLGRAAPWLRSVALGAARSTDELMRSQGKIENASRIESGKGRRTLQEPVHGLLGSPHVQSCGDTHKLPCWDAYDKHTHRYAETGAQHLRIDDESRSR